MLSRHLVLLSLQATSTVLFDISLGIQPADISEGGKNLSACNTWTPHRRPAMRSECLIISLYRAHLLICEVNYTIINRDFCQAFLRRGQAAGSSENWPTALGKRKKQNKKPKKECSDFRMCTLLWGCAVFALHWYLSAAAAAAKSLQSCPTLCDPIDRSPLGSSVPGMLQARLPKFRLLSTTTTIWTQFNVCQTLYWAL